MCASEKPLGGSQLFFHFAPPTHAAQEHSSSTGATSSPTRSNGVEGFPAVCQRGTCQFKCKIKSRMVGEKFNFTRQQNNHIFLSIFLSPPLHVETKDSAGAVARLPVNILSCCRDPRYQCLINVSAPRTA